jgi:Divergent InlB B-repeat domain/RTX calcium-binding nonapeptide repeat (4 copies)
VLRAPREDLVPERKGNGLLLAAKTNRRWPTVVVVAVAVVASSFVQTPEAYAAKARPKCLGKKATIVGNNKANTIKGTKKADVIVAKGGNDRINGRGGADRICGGGGKDKIFGGPGNDRMDGGKGNDECRQQGGKSMPKKNCDGPKFQLTVSKAGSGAGTVTSSPAGIDCGGNCSLSVVEGESISLTATAASGSTFNGWAGACTGTSGCSVVVSKAQSVIATFTADPAPPPPPTFSLAITTSGTGSGNISSSPGGINCGSDCSEVYTQGTSVTLTVSPSSGSVFDGWSGACSGTGSCVLTMDAAKTANAAFTKVSYNLHVDRVFQGTGATGTVTSAPTGINCGADCDQVYDHGTAITLTATAGAGSRFVSWSGCDSGTGNPCSINLVGATTATATFVKIWDLGVTKDGGSGNGSGTVTSSPSGINCGLTCTANFDEGSSVTLTASASSGSRFDSWSGCDSTAGNQCTVTMTGTKAVVASFVRIWSLAVTKDGAGSGTVTSNPSGISCGSTCSANFDHGSSVVLTATAAAGSRFGSWSGCDSPSGNQCTMTMTAAKSVTATFVKLWDLTVTKNGSGNGTVTSSPSGINCGSDCSETYDQGTNVTLTASAAAGSRFDSWSGCDSTAGSQCDVSVNGAESVTATFVKLWDLTVAKNGSGSGTVTSSPSGINCGSDCAETYDQGTSVTLTGTSSAGSRFDSWSGCDSTTGNQCTVNMTAAKSVTATFVKVWDMTVTKSGSGSGTVTSAPAGINCGSDCTETYDQGTSVVLTATAASGSRLDSFSGCDSIAGNQCTVNVNGVESVTVTFVKQWDLTVTKSGSGGGSVTSSPAGINCGGTCTAPFDEGSSVTLTATADTGSVFTGWSGSGCSGTGTCVVTMDAAKSVTATFVPGRILTVSTAGTGGGTVTSSPSGINCGSDCAETYLDGQSVTLTATPDATSTFTGWSGSGCSGTGNCVLTMNADKSVTATFTRITFNLHVDRTMPNGSSGTVTSSPSGINCGSDCDESYVTGTEVTLTATADSGSAFVSWSGCDSTNGNQCTVTMSAAKNVTATFKKVWDLTVTKTTPGGGGAGTVTSSPSGINCGADCTETYDHNTVVTLTAAASAGSRFSGWSGEGCSGTGTCVVTMNATRNVTATFVKTWTLTVSRTGLFQGTVTSSPAGINCGSDCTEVYDHGTSVTLTRSGGGVFTGWSGGGCSGTGTTCVVTMNSDQAVTAAWAGS